MSEEKLVPKLRFSGFDGEWNETTLSDIATFSKGKGISKKDISDDGIECVRYGELYTKYTEMIYNVDSKTNLDENELQLSEKYDILIPCSGETAIDLATASCIQKDQVAIGGDITIIKTNQYAPFITYYLNQKKTEIAKYAQGVSIVHLYPKDFNVLNIKIPLIKEQKKIVHILEKISYKEQLLEKKLKSYQDFKKYLMQQIFTQKLRFNDNNNEPYENWEGLQLKDIISLQGGYAFKSELFKDEGVPIIRISNISPNNSVILDDLVYYDKLDNDSDFIIKKGELIIAMSGATTGKVGVYDLDQIAYINQRVGLFKQISNELYYPFLIQYTLSDTFKRELQKTLVAGAQPNISKKEIESFKINLPQYGEQKKIADLLFNIDLKINTVKNQSTEISQFKKGLLQQMFV